MEGDGERVRPRVDMVDETTPTSLVEGRAFFVGWGVKRMPAPERLLEEGEDKGLVGSTFSSRSVSSVRKKRMTSDPL